MAQHDYIISNQTFPNTRADLNNVLQAIATCNKGSSAPSTQYAGQMWIDDSAGTTWTLYLYDGSDNIQVATIDTTANTINFIDSVVTGFNIVTDTTPQLGGNLDTNGNDISFGDSDKANFGASSDLQIYHDGSDSYIDDVGAGNLIMKAGSLRIKASNDESMIDGNANGAVNLYYDNSKKFETTTNGITVTGSVLATNTFAGDDNIKLQLGNSGDFQIYHNGTSNYVMGTTPRSLILGTNNTTTMTIDTAQNAIFDYGVLLNEGTLTDGATIAWDINASPVAKVTLGGNRTISAPSNQAGSGQFISLLVIQDGTGSRTLTWNAIYEFKDDTAPTLTTTASKGDLFVFRYYGAGSKWVEVGRNQNLSLS